MPARVVKNCRRRRDLNSSRRFFKYDYRSSLFPMFTTAYLINHSGMKLLDYSKQCIEASGGNGFSPQAKVYASKPKFHLRRTQKLDPVAEYFIYDLVYRNRKFFKEPKSDLRKHFGYRFDDQDRPTSPTEAYGAFKKAQADYDRKYRYSLSFDVASYFNSVRQDDIIEWCHLVGINQEDTRALDVFLEQTNSGRGSDCWPQGIYPAKMVGNDFLRFSEESPSLKALAAIRFLDDFVLYSDKESDLAEDFFLVQKLLGARGLSVNPSKTSLRTFTKVNVDEPSSSIRSALLLKSRNAIHLAYADDFDDAYEGISLEDDELDFIRKILVSDRISEEDAELVLTVSRNHSNEVMPHLGKLFLSHPHIAKRAWSFCSALNDVGFTIKFLNETSSSDAIQEYQLFWLAQILADTVSDMIEDGASISQIAHKLYKHKNASDLSRAKLLEINVAEPALMEWRRENLLSGSSDWKVWASAVGHREVIQNSSVRRFSSFSNASTMNSLILSVIREPFEQDDLDVINAGF